MTNNKIAILGGGLSGLYAAYLLEQQGITDYVLLEARDVLGGRISSASIESASATDSASAIAATDKVDLGPTWFWPDFQHQLDSLITELKLERFNQYDTGNMVIERSPHEAPVVMRGYSSSPPSMRLIGGMEALIHKLHSKLSNTQILLGKTVSSIQKTNKNIEVCFQDTAEPNVMDSTFVQHVLLAMPPRLVEKNINFVPALPGSLASQWRNTATWMAGHAKYIAVYDTPFWREAGLSGSAQSRLGPMVEIHDASMPNGSAALFGFIGVPATVRKSVTDEELKAHCLNQLIRLFGGQASTPKSTLLKDWAQEPFTATSLDFDEVSHHGSAPEMLATDNSWEGKLIGIGSEWSTQFPGYIAGAIEAATDGISEYIHQIAKTEK
jgi:monoamine oxidase